VKEISVKNIPDGSYRLNSLHIKEILTKYPDKVVSVVDRDRDTVVIMDTCRLVLTKEEMI